MLLGQTFNNILYTRRFNALKQITGDPRKKKPLLKEKKRYLLKKNNFYLVKDLILISLELPKVNKNLRKFSRQLLTNNSHFEGTPYWNTKKIRLGGRMSRWCSLKITHHNIHGSQANSNTKINIGHSFKGNEVKLCHSKVLKLHLTHSLLNVALKIYVVSLSQAFSTFKSRNPKRQSLLNLHHL